MLVDRRTLLALVASGSAAGLLPSAAFAAETGPRAERSIGSPDAKTVVGEYFSLTCTHCAAFAQQTMPKIKAELIDTGKVRWVFHDFPLDQVALTAAMVARYLPVDRYEPFVNALFASQDRWAFARGVNSNDELAKMAALAGMSRATFDKAVADTDLRNWILKQQDEDQKKWNVDSTPSFVVDGKKYAGEMSFEAFRKLLPAT
ncbi:MAG: DsbA family protein [Rhodospirillales bacterium]|nr:DsbA family protein [Rhodospirillales bacterium]